MCNATLIRIVIGIFLSSPHDEKKNVEDESFASQTCCKDSMKTIIILNATQKLSSVHCEQWVDISWHRTIKLKRKEKIIKTIDAKKIQIDEKKGT